MTIRLAQQIGMERVVETAEKFDIMDNPPPQLSLAIGAGETTLMRITAAYAMLVNGGKRVAPSLIDRVQDRRGRTVYRNDKRACAGCLAETWENLPPPRLPDERRQVTDPASAYQIVSMLQGVVERGTGRKIAEIGKPLAGKTGTTNDNQDAWFVGFSPDLAVGVYVGFDQPRTLGARETGSAVAVPIWKDFMAAALDGMPGTPFRIPDGIRLVRVVHDTGLPARPGEGGVIWEAFKPGTVPSAESLSRDEAGAMPSLGEGTARAPAAGGLY
jgi:penicillin-binding protein 1A